MDDVLRTLVGVWHRREDGLDWEPYTVLRVGVLERHRPDHVELAADRLLPLRYVANARDSRYSDEHSRWRVIGFIGQ